MAGAWRLVGLAVAALVLALASAGGAGSWGGPGGDFLHALALQPDGKIVVVGAVNESHLLLERYGTDGRLDASFGASGRVVTDEPPDVASAVAIGSEGRIVVAGSGHVFRYRADGRLDESFGDRGVVEMPVTGVIAAVAVQPDGMIVVGGRSADSPTRFLLARLRTDGTPDPSFGGGGVVTTAFEDTADVRSLALRPDGRILAAGTLVRLPTGGRALALARYLADGRLDPGFGNGGRVTTEACDGGFEGNAVALSPDGRITAGGSALARYVPDGRLDPSFAGGAPVPLGLYARALVLPPDGGAIVAGGAIARFRADGALDPGFGVDGVVGVGLFVQAAALDASGRIVVGGSKGDFRASSLWLKRYLPNGQPDRAFVIGRQGDTVEEIRTLTTTTGRLRTLLQADRLAAAALSPDRRKLALIRSVAGRLELDLLGIDGKGLRRLLVSPFLAHELTAESTISWSPDGRKVAFDAWPVPFPASCSTAAPRGAVYVLEVGKRRLRRLGAGSGPRWSPDGRRIAFVDGLKLFVTNVDGSGRRAITGDARPSFSWSPDGRRIAFVEAQHAWIAVVGRDGRGKRRLALGRAPAWSPSGKQIAYQRLDCPSDRGYDCLRLVRPGGGGFHSLARFRGGSLSPVSWSSDGTRIAVPVWPRPSPPNPVGERPWKIAVVTVSTGRVLLYSVGAAPVMPSAPAHWGAAGRTLLFVVRNIPADGLR